MEPLVGWVHCDWQVRTALGSNFLRPPEHLLARDLIAPECTLRNAGQVHA